MIPTTRLVGATPRALVRTVGRVSPAAQGWPGLNMTASPRLAAVARVFGERNSEGNGRVSLSQSISGSNCGMRSIVMREPSTEWLAP